MEERISMEGAAIFILLFSSLHIQKIYTAEVQTVSDSQFLTYGDTLVSSKGVFELGFFRPGSSENRYLGIWYKKISVRTVVWVANRGLPLSSASSGVLRITDPGNLVLGNNISDMVWSSNTTTPSRNAIARLLDTGNLVLTDVDNHEKVLWQSFDYPTDTLLPGMKEGRDLLAGKEWYVSSWASSQDPAPGEFTWRVDTSGYPQKLLKQGAIIKFRAGPWNGLRFSGASEFGQNNIFTYSVVINKYEAIYSYILKNNSVILRWTLNPSGVFQRSVWVEDSKKWQSILTLPKDFCDTYSICGAYGICSTVNSKACVCLDNTRFVPRNQKGWESADWSGGCVRRTPLDCKNGSDGFIKYSNVKLPDTRSSWFNMTMSLEECEAICLKNCTCMAYTNTDIRDEGSGCLLWFNELIDIRVLSEGNGGQDIFVRMASSELDHRVMKSSGSNEKKELIFKVALPLIIGTILLGLSLVVYIWRKKTRSQMMREGRQGNINEEDIELAIFALPTIAKATKNFSINYKLGEGGFGPVYKGILDEGQEIAVKRLSKTSTQGVVEFKNEVVCIAKLQHRNLVRLLGYCLEDDEMMLIYEYMPNKSLDSFIFDEERRKLLDWPMRYQIINGIARGLLYLHQDSRLRIIHRDLKASNILLDSDMNPKISDFGLARRFGGNEMGANTRMVVGTYGYISPEYAVHGLFSVKSDVFSFGVLLLEIMSGKKNRGFFQQDHSNNLLGHAWRLYKEDKCMKLIDTTLLESFSVSEALRSLQVGLLCVQHSPGDRPSMSSVVLMLAGEGALPEPKQPGFFTEDNICKAQCSLSAGTPFSVNEVSITLLDGR